MKPASVDAAKAFDLVECDDDQAFAVAIHDHLVHVAAMINAYFVIALRTYFAVRFLS